MEAMKLTLSTNKVVVLRPLQIKFYRLAAQAAAKTAGDNRTVLSIVMQDEILKLLLISVDGKELKGHEKEDLDMLFQANEYRQLMMCMEEMIGNVERPKIEVVTYSSGSKLPGSVATQV